MTADGLSGTEITYNILSLPSIITKNDGSSLNYSYLADGRKMSSLTEEGEGVVYRGPFTYRRSADGSLEFEGVRCPEGMLVPDPLSENYYSVSPYAYCANNPVMCVDPDGRSRRIYIDYKSKTIIISTTFVYTDKRLTKGLSQAQCILNNMTDLQYEISGVNFSLRFKVHIKQVSTTDGFNSYIWSDLGNSVIIDDDLPELSLGVTINDSKSNSIKVLTDSADDPIVLAHEMIHTMGGNPQVHAKDGLMQKNRTSNQSTVIYHETIEDIVERGYGKIEEKGEYMKRLIKRIISMFK